MPTVALDANRFRRGAYSNQSCGFSTQGRSGTCCRRAIRTTKPCIVGFMAIVDRHGLPLSVSTHGANHHEVRLVQLCFDFFTCLKPTPRPSLAIAPMIVTRSMTTYAETASRWSRRTAPIAASARRKMDADFGDMQGAGWSNGSSPGFNGSAASLSAGSVIRRKLPRLRTARLPRHPLQTILR